MIDDLRNKLISALRSELAATSVDDADAVKQALFKILNPLGVLGDTSNYLGGPADGVDPGDIIVDTTNGTPEFKFLLDYDIFSSLTNLGFDIGLPGLNLSSDAKLKADLAFTWLVDFGVSATDGFFLDTSAAKDLDLALNVTLISSEDTNKNGVLDPGEDTDGNGKLTVGKGELGFLQLAVSDLPTTGGGPNRNSYLAGDVGIDLSGLGDNHLTLAELSSGPNLASLVTPTLGLDANVHLGLNVTFGGNLEFPNFSTEFVLQWNLNGTSPDASAGPQKLEFDNVALELGSFVTRLLGPIIHDVKSVLDPVKPVLDFLTTRIPVLSDIPGLKELLGDGSVTPNPDGLTVLEIANRVGNFFGVPPEIFDAIAVVDKVNDIANLLTGVSLNGQLNLPLGDFNLLELRPPRGATSGRREASTGCNCRLTPRRRSRISNRRSGTRSAAPASNRWSTRRSNRSTRR